MASLTSGVGGTTVRALRRLGPTSDALRAATTRTPARLDPVSARDEGVTADHTRAQFHVGRRELDGEAVATPKALHVVPVDLDLRQDVDVLGGDRGGSRRAVTQPCTQRVWRDQEIGVGKVERLRQGHAVIQASIRSLAPQRCLDVARRLHARERPLIDGPISLVSGRLERPAAGPSVCQPLVLLVGDDARPVGEGDLVAGATRHHFGRGHDTRRPPVGTEHLVTDGNLAHRRPARRRRQRRVERQGLPHRRTGRDDDHLARVQTVGQVVEVDESGGHTDHLARRPRGVLDLVGRGLEEVAEEVVVLAAALVGDLVDLGLRCVDDVLDVAAARAVAHLDDPGAGVDEAAQHGTLGDDLGVVARVRRGGHRRDELVEVGLPADAGQVAALGQLVGDGDGVGRLTAAVEVEDRVVDELMGRAVEVDAARDLQDVGDRVLGEQHPAEDTLLRMHVLRRDALVPIASGTLLEVPLQPRH